MNKKIAVLTGVLCGVLVLVVASLSKRDRSRSPQELVVGMMSGWAPFMTIANDGSFEGFDVAIAKEIGKRLGKTVKIVDFGSLAPLFLALEQGRIDCALSGLDITALRKTKYAMLRYTGDDIRTYELVFWRKIPAGITTYADLKNRSDLVIAVESGSAQEAFVEQTLLPTATIKRLDAVTDMLLDLSYGKSDALLLEPRIARRLQKKTPELQLLTIALPEQFIVEGCGLAMKKNSPLAGAVQTALSQMTSNGTIKQLELQWGLA